MQERATSLKVRSISLIAALWLALAGLASAQQILTSSPVYTAASAPATVLYVANFSEFNVLLTANAPIVFSLPTVAPNSIPFRVNFCQNSTGGFQPTFSTITGATIVNNVGSANVTTTANACTTQFWTFRAATNQVILNSTSPFTGSGTFTAITASVNNIINFAAPPYNGDPTGTNDSQPAFEQAAAALCTANKGGTLTGSAGHYKLNEPAYFLCANNTDFEIAGTGDVSFFLQPTGTFPALSAVGFDYMSILGPIAGPALATGGSAFSGLWGTSASTYFYDVNETIAGSGSSGVQNILNGRSSLSVEMYVKPIQYSGASLNTNYGIIEAAPPDTAGLGEEALAEYWNYNTTSQIFPCIDLSSSGLVPSFCATGYNITTNTTHETELTLSGGKLYFFIDGVDQTSGGITATGTIVEGIHDLFKLGRTDSAQDAQMAGNIDSVCISSGAQHTSGFTPPTAKFAHSGTHCDLYLQNFNHVGTITGSDSAPFSSVDYANGANTPIWTRVINTLGTTSVGPVNIHDIGFTGGTIGLYASLMPNMSVVNLRGNNQTYYGLALNNDTFASNFGPFYFNPAGSTGSCYDFEMDALGASNGNGPFQCEGGGAYNPQMFINGPGGTLTNIQLSASSTSTQGLVYAGVGSAEDQLHLISPETDSENGASAYTGITIAGAAGSVQLEGGSIQGGGTGYCLELDDQFGHLDMTLIGTICNAATSYAAHVGTTTFLQPAKWINGEFNQAALTQATASNSIPNFNITGTIAIPFASLPSCGATLDGVSYYVVTNATACTTGSLITGAGSTYCTAICNGGTGWVH
jgi:hypothetical protein